jgi:hypothetical protein
MYYKGDRCDYSAIVISFIKMCSWNISLSWIMYPGVNLFSILALYSFPGALNVCVRSGSIFWYRCSLGHGSVDTTVDYPISDRGTCSVISTESGTFNAERGAEVTAQFSAREKKNRLLASILSSME